MNARRSSATKYPAQLRKFVNAVEKRARKTGHTEAAARIFGAWSACYVRYCTLRDRPWQNERNVPGFLDYLKAREDVNTRSQERAVKGLVFLFEELLNTDVSGTPWYPSPKAASSSGDGAPTESNPKSDSEGKGATQQSSLLTQLLFHTSLPINEALDLRAGDIDPDAGLIYVSDALGTPKRIVEMPDTLSDTLREYIAEVRAERGIDYLDAPLFQAHALAGRVDEDAEDASETSPASKEKPTESSTEPSSASSSQNQSPEGASLWSYT